MDTLNLLAVAPSEIEEMADHDVVAAQRYIDAIIGREPTGSASADRADLRRRDLWEKFVHEYRSATTGPYSRRDGAALRLALGRI